VMRGLIDGPPGSAAGTRGVLSPRMSVVGEAAAAAVNRG
jgi:hypothetical protein